jgi:GNAT superfamily N-acetyltransferase
MRTFCFRAALSGMTDKSSERVIRRLNIEEIRTVFKWAEQERWNPGADDSVAFQSADPNGFFGAFVDDQLVASVSAVAYDDHFGFIGLYLCRPEYRKQGHGKAVFDAGIAYLGEKRTIGLDGVPEQQANYRRSGFEIDYETIGIRGTLSPATEKTQVALTPELVAELNRECFPAPRPVFVQHWLGHTTCAVTRDDGSIAGYAVHRPTRTNFKKVGPIFADNVETAIKLLSMIDGDVHLEVPSSQTVFIETLAARGLKQVSKTARMYKGPAPKIAQDKVFSLTCLELG